MSFSQTLARVERSVARNQRTLEQLARERGLIKSRVAEVAMASLDRRLALHEERVRGALAQLELEKTALLDLVARSPELALEPGVGAAKRSK